jgi:ABC-type glycerol-3-phosphate transport system permease component
LAGEPEGFFNVMAMVRIRDELRSPWRLRWNAIITTLVAMVGAVLLTVLAAYVNGRLYARHL